MCAQRRWMLRSKWLNCAECWRWQFARLVELPGTDVSIVPHGEVKRIGNSNGIRLGKLSLPQTLAPHSGR